MASDRDMAWLAKEVYYVTEKNGVIDGWEGGTAEGWKVEKVFENRDNGYKSALFSRTNSAGGTDRVIAYAGTDEWQDYIGADADIVMGKVSHQWKEALEFYQDNKEDGLTGITGHSREGGLRKWSAVWQTKAYRL